MLATTKNISMTTTHNIQSINQDNSETIRTPSKTPRLTINIRLANLADVDKITECIVECYTGGKSWLDYSDHVTGTRTDAEEVRKIISTPTVIMIICEETDQDTKQTRIVSTVFSRLEFTMPYLRNTEKFIDITVPRASGYSLTVRPEYQSAGIGRDLVARMEASLLSYKHKIVNNNFTGLTEQELNFVMNNKEHLKDFQEFMLTCVADKPLLEKFYNSFGYFRTGYSIKASELGVAKNLKLKKDFTTVLMTKKALTPKF